MSASPYLPDPNSISFIKNALSGDRYALISAFTFSETPEGFDFWADWSFDGKANPAVEDRLREIIAEYDRQNPPQEPPIDTGRYVLGSSRKKASLEDLRAALADNSDVFVAFTWMQTPEGVEFWENYARGTGDSEPARAILRRLIAAREAEEAAAKQPAEIAAKEDPVAVAFEEAVPFDDSLPADTVAYSMITVEDAEGDIERLSLQADDATLSLMLPSIHEEFDEISVVIAYGGESKRIRLDAEQLQRWLRRASAVIADQFTGEDD